MPIASKLIHDPSKLISNDHRCDKLREISAMLGRLLLLYLVCFMAVCLIKSNCYSLIYSSLIDIHKQGGIKQKHRTNSCSLVVKVIK